SASEIELEVGPCACDRRIHRPVRDLPRGHPGPVGDAEREEKLHPAESAAGIGRVSDDDRASRAADAEPDQEHCKKDRERIRGGGEEKRKQARPYQLGAKRSESRKRDSDVDGRWAVYDRRTTASLIWRAFREQKARARGDRVKRDRRQGRSSEVKL